MRTNLSILLGFTIFFLAGCATADQKIPEMATDVCNCFTDMEKNMSSKTKEIMSKAAESASPQTTLATELQNLPEDERMTIAQEMMSIGEMQDKNSKIGRCMGDIEKKYGDAKTFDKKKSLDKLIKELESKTGCSFAASLMKMGSKSKNLD